jgi:hypothetical protein
MLGSRVLGPLLSGIKMCLGTTRHVYRGWGKKGCEGKRSSKQAVQKKSTAFAITSMCTYNVSRVFLLLHKNDVNVLNFLLPNFSPKKRNRMDNWKKRQDPRLKYNVTLTL